MERLQHQYSFDCTCESCISDLDTHALARLSFEEDSLFRTEWGIFGLSPSQLSPTVSSSPTAASNVPYSSFQNLNALPTVADRYSHLYSLLKPNLPSTRSSQIATYPCTIILQSLYSTSLSVGAYGFATLILCAQISLTNPVIYPQPHHPSRIAAYLALAKLLYVAFTESSAFPNMQQIGDRLGCGSLVRALQADLPSVMYSLLKLAEFWAEKGYGSESRFMALVRRKLKEVTGGQDVLMEWEDMQQRFKLIGELGTVENVMRVVEMMVKT